MPACAVIYCGSRTERGVRLFSLPQGGRNEERRNTWIQNIDRKELPTNIFVCEKHFEEDQFENNRKDGRRPLKYNAIPTVFQNKRLKVEDNQLPLKRSRRSPRILKPKTYDAYVSEDEDDLEVEKNKKGKKCEKKLRCRTCLAIFEISSGHVLRKQMLGKPIKDRILMFVPKLNSLLDTEYICDKCHRLLTNFTRFYESCLDTDMKLKSGKISLTVDEKGKEDSQEGKSSKNVEIQSTAQKVGRKRKQDLVSFHEDNTEEVHDIVKEENVQEEVVTKKRGRPRKVVVPQDEISAVKDVKKKAIGSQKNSTSQNEGSLKVAGDESEVEGDSSKDVVTEPVEETTLGEKDIETEEKENSAHRKSNVKEPEEKKSDDCNYKTNSTTITDHDYVNEMIHCPECQTGYRTSKGMKNHLTSHHNILEEHEFHCTVCNMKFIRYKDMLKHKNTHGSPCDLCDKIFSNADELKSHTDTHPEAYCCMKCGSVFEQEDMLEKHSLLHDAMTKVISAIQKSLHANNCVTCGATFTAKQKLLDHVKTVHLQIKDVKCPECDRQFSTKSLMSIHLRLKHSNNKPHKCDVCEASFKRSDHLALHKLTHNFSDPNRRTYGRAKDDPGKLYQCPFCFTTSSTKQLLITHLSIHANERKFECSYCGLKLSSVRTRTIHEKTHEADPNSQFVCMTCWKKFPTEEDLKSHELKHVPNIKRFSCCLCGAQFGRKLMLENHLLDLHIKSPDIENKTVDTNIKIIKVQWKNDDDDDDEVDDTKEESEDVVEVNDDDIDGENLKDEQDCMEEKINKATFIILDEKDICTEEF